MPWLLIAATLAVGLLAANVFLTFKNIAQLRDDVAWVNHTREVMVSLERALSSVRAAESGQRGYLITGELPYLQPHREAIGSIDRELDRLQKLTVDDPNQQERIARVKQLVAERLRLLDEGLALRRGEGFDASRQFTMGGGGREAMEVLGTAVAEMLLAEEQLLTQRSRRTRESYRWARSTGMASTAAALVALLALLYLLRRHLAARSEATGVINTQRETLQTTLASIGDAVITTDSEGRVTYLNPVAESLTGWTLPMAKGQPLESVFRIVNEETRAPVANPVVRALREGAIVGLANHTVLVSREGTARPIDDSAAPIRDGDGHIVGCVLVFRDVSAKRQSDLTLRQSQQRFELAVRGSHDGIWDWDVRTGESFYSDRCLELWGYAPGEIAPVFETWVEGIHPEDWPRVQEALANHMERRAPYVVEYRRRTKSGEYRWYRSSGEAVWDASGEPIRMAGSMADVTDRKRESEALREADRRKDEFLATLAHELRNPLAPIRNALSVLKIAHADAQTFERTRAMMERQLGQMVRLIDDLLDMSRITRGTLTLRLERVELASVVHHAVESSRPLIEEAKHELTVTLPSHPVYVTADPLRLAQVFSNLLGNACKYTEPGGRILLAAAVHEGNVAVSVRDTGVGIPPEMLTQIFEMFTQADRSLGRSQGGLGIGLALSQRLVDLHGGTLSARSDGTGTGSEFVVRLRTASDQTPLVPVPGSADEWVATPGRRVLVVDDNEDSAVSLGMLVEMNGHVIHTARDGLQAIEAAARHRPDAILLDIGLPKLDGYEVARRIRKQPWGKRIVLVALTGWGKEEDVRRAREAGFDHHFVKPVDTAALLKVLAGLAP